ncbi:MAG: DUF354 domain-containing protein [Ignavibacteria bacterium]|jgi:predicted glycosyltransferase
MNLLFDIGHPAHVHLFRNFINYLKEKEHSVFVVSRKKDVTEILLDHYKIKHFPITTAAKTKRGMIKELLARNKFIFDLHRKYKFDASFGTSASIGFLKFRYGVPAYNFNEDDDEVIRLYTYLAYPLADKVINPDCLKYKKWKNKRVFYPSYHELSYLHTNTFTPDINVVKSYGLEPNQYVILRLSALKAHHDVGINGIGADLLSRIRELIRENQIIESSELKKEYKVKPWDMHHILAFSKFLISDSQTMTAEAAVLGIPSVRINDFVGKISYLEELEHKYELTFGYKPKNYEGVLDKISFFNGNAESTKKNWKLRMEKLLKEKIDFNKWMIDYFGF